MRKQYDFSKAKRAKDVPHLARLQTEAKGKTRITMMLDNDLLVAFRAKAEAEGIGYQTLINRTLRQASGSGTVDEDTLRRILREELRAGKTQKMTDREPAGIVTQSGNSRIDRANES